MFTVRLPFEPAREVGVVGSSITPRRSGSRSWPREIDSWTDPRSTLRPGGEVAGPRLLVVEDVRVELVSWPRRWAVTARSRWWVMVCGRWALRDRHVDIVLTDLTMPVLDGLGLISRSAPIRVCVTCRWCCCRPAVPTRMR